VEFPTILASLRRHKTAAALIVLEIAFSCAILCNAVFLIGERAQRMQRPSGVAEQELVRIQLTGVGRDADADALTREDLRALRHIPGVIAAASSNQVPFGGSSWNSSVNLRPEQMNPTLVAATYFGSEELLETLGLRLQAGRDFHRDEYVELDLLQSSGGQVKLPAVIITRSMADRLFPGKNGLGESLYIWGEEPLRVVGVVDHLIRPNEQGGPAGRENAVILPVRMPYTAGGNYLLRVPSARRTQVLQAAVAELQRISPNRIILAQQTFEGLRQDYFRQDRAMVWLLVAVCGALLVVTALGIVGLASFWVQQRTRQIGIRRALGATRGQILRHFQAENLVLTTLGTALGMALACGINAWLMQHHELPRLPTRFLPAGALSLWLLGQVAVLGPALRAAAVPPVVATRSL
jgi:putative ABC transport system permease protein